MPASQDLRAIDLRSKDSHPRRHSYFGNFPSHWLIFGGSDEDVVDLEMVALDGFVGWDNLVDHGDSRSILDRAHLDRLELP